MIDGQPPPTPERIARWEEHAVRLLAVRTAPDGVIDALRHIGCPKELAQEIVARSQTPAASAMPRDDAVAAGYPTATRTLRNMRSHGESSGQSAGCQLRLALRGVRSGCGIRIVARPSRLVTPAMASSDPFGLAG